MKPMKLFWYLQEKGLKTFNPDGGRCMAEGIHVAQGSRVAKLYIERLLAAAALWIRIQAYLTNPKWAT
jgi:hypothetical protein